MTAAMLRANATAVLHETAHAAVVARLGLGPGSFVDGRGRLHLPRVVISTVGVVPTHGRDLPRWQERELDPNRVYKMLRGPDVLVEGARTFEGKELLGDLGSDRIGFVQDVKIEGHHLLATAVVCRRDARHAIEAGARLRFSAGCRFAAVQMYRGIFEGHYYDGRALELHGTDFAVVIR